MKKTTYTTGITALVFCLIIAAGCSKNQTDSGTIPASNAGTWRLTSFQVTPAYNNTVTDLLAYYDTRVNGTCYSGITYTFSSTGTIQLNYPAGCVTGSDYSYFDNGDQWSVSGNQLLINGVKTGRRTFDLDMSGNTMKLTYQSTSNTGTSVTSTYTALFSK